MNTQILNVENDVFEFETKREGKTLAKFTFNFETGLSQLTFDVDLAQKMCANCVYANAIEVLGEIMKDAGKLASEYYE